MTVLYVKLEPIVQHMGLLFVYSVPNAVHMHPMQVYALLEVHMTVFLAAALVDMKALALYVYNALLGITNLPVQVLFALRVVLAPMHLA